MEKSASRDAPATMGSRFNEEGCSLFVAFGQWDPDRIIDVRQRVLTKKTAP